MTFFQYTVVAFSSINFFIYILAGRSFFVATHAKAPSYLFVVSFIALFLSTMYGLVFSVQKDPYLLTASVLMSSLSLFIFFCAKNATKARPFTVVFSPDLPQHLVTNGIYHYIRHPFYSAYIATFVACALASTSFLPLTCAVVIAVAYTWAAKFEEKKFSHTELRERYRNYQDHAGLFWPKIISGATLK